MIASDVHYDSILCDVDLLTKHLKLAEQNKSPVLIAGDLFDAMQGRDDPRRSIEELKAEYKVASYFDAIVLDVSKFLQRFKVPYYVIALGNHETSVLRKINTDLVERLCYDLRLHGQPAEAMGYWGYIRFMFNYKHGNAKASKTLYFHHGTSTSAPVTKGVIQTNRQSVYIHDADFVLNGHNHHAYLMPVQVEKLNAKTMQPYTQSVWYMRTPGYKQSPGDGMQTLGFGAEKHRTPTPRGCMFLNMTYTHTDDTIEAEILQKIQ
jgi:UDP-2,3-diacylglucosamine pyrophosphatase LpxH